MISAPVTFFFDKTLPPQSGRAAQAADVTAARDFADMMSRLFYSNMPIAAIARAAEIPDTTLPSPGNDRIGPEPASEDAGRAERRETENIPEEEVATAEHPENARPEPAEPAAPDGPPPQEAETVSSAPAFPLLQPPPQAAPILATPPAQQAGERPLAQGVTPFIQAKEGDTPPAATQQARHASGGPGELPRIQVVDGNAKDQPPPLGHMLSGRAAVVAQSDDGSTALKGGLAEQPAASLFGSAAQASAMAAQKAKGQSKPANAAGAGQNAGGAQPAQAAAQQAQQATPAAAAAQTAFDSALAANNGPGQLGALSPQASRSELFPLAGTAAQQTPQGSFRAAAPTAAKPRLPVPPRFIADQVAVQIQKSLNLGNDKISIQLRPAELGKVEVRLDVGHEGRVTAVITADRADTLDLLQRDARILQHSLQDAGLRADSNSLSFELRSNGQAFDQEHDGTGNARRSADTGIDSIGSLDAGEPKARPRIVTDDRVDIHV